MKVFPAVCALITVVFYVVAYSRISGSAPPPSVVREAQAAPTASRASTSADVSRVHLPLAEAVPVSSPMLTSATSRATAPPSVDAKSAWSSSTGKSVPTTVAQSNQVEAPPRAALVLDGSLSAGLKFAVQPGQPRFLLVTFGNLGVKDQMLNFVSHARRAGAAHIVGGVDVGTFDLMVSQGTAAYKTPLASESYQLDGSNQHSSGSWKRFAGMRTGEVYKIVSAGYTVLHTDCDVVWLRNPMPYLMCDASSGRWEDDATFPCAPLLEADVAVSSDNMSPDRDFKQHAGYSAGGTFNTGLLMIRASPKGVQFAREWHRLVVEPPRGSRFAALTSDQQVFNNMMRKDREWPGISAPSGAWVMDSWDKSVRLGALPLPLFINGHGYFSAHRRLGVSPLCVHATYSLDNHDAVAKAQRFREAGLWDADSEQYYQKGGGFLALNGTISPALRATIDKYVRHGESPANIAVHAQALSEYTRELRDALAIARLLGRTLVLPQWMCYCDRLWSGSDDIFHFGCMYPGAQEGKFVPFVCPMDHVLSPAVWARSDVSYRDPAFLSSPRRPAGAIVDVQLLPRESFEAGSGSRGARLPLGASADEVKVQLSSHDATFLRLPHARGVLCGLSDASETEQFNRVARSLLSVPQWCAKCYQPCMSELSKWLPQDEIRRGTSGGSFFCLNVPPPPPFRHGSCSLNVRAT